jgi:transcriptional regulator with XRE-family HTH domain
LGALLEIGSTLRDARSRAGLELTAVEAATMIPVRYLNALENEQFDQLPVAPYRRSFLREYARYLGLDADALASEYELQYEPAEPELAHPAPRPGDTFDTVLAALTPGRIVTALLLCVIGLAVWLLGSSGGSNPGSRSTATRPLGHPALTAAPAVKRQHVAASSSSPLPPAAPSLTLVAARGPCWLLVAVGSATGRAVYVRTLQPGGTLHFGLRKPLWIRVGAPWNLDASIGDRTVTSSLPPRTGDLIATADGLQATS